MSDINYYLIIGVLTGFGLSGFISLIGYTVGKISDMFKQ